MSNRKGWFDVTPKRHLRSLAFVVAASVMAVSCSERRPTSTEQVESTTPTIETTTNTTGSETTAVEAAESESETANSETGSESSLSSDASLDNEEGQNDETQRWLMTLEAISLEEEQPRSGYDRDSWPHWRDTNGTGCDSRKDLVMLYAFEDAVLDYDSCSVSGGVWYSWFDGVTTDNSSSFDVDHIVSLAEAHDSGGANWSRSKKQEFANDERNLVLVSASSNRSKSDKDVAEWRPMQSVWCVTARMIVSVKYTYGLSVDQAEFDALEEMFGYCGKEGQISWWVENLTMPTSAPSTTAAVTQTTTATQPSAPSSTDDEIPPNPGNTKNCSDFDTYQEAKAWFDYYYPHYGDVAFLDSDGDGEPCESLAELPTPTTTIIGDTTTSVPVVQPSSYAIDISGFSFASSALTIRVGDTVTWTNLDSAIHTVTFSGSASLSSSGLQEGDTHSVTFDSVGTYAYGCSPHPSMQGTITVTK